MKYFDELKRTMDWIANQKDVVFLGQAVGVPGTFMFNTISEVDPNLRIELPVCESFQMQLTIGHALAGRMPISIFPRLNFLMLAMGDLVNMLDKLPDLYPQSKAKVIIRTSAGPDTPIHPGHQHIGDFSDPLRMMLKNVDVVRLDEPAQIFPAYQRALDPSNNRSSILIEVGNYYSSK